MAARFVEVSESEIDQFKVKPFMESSHSKVGSENLSFASNTIY